MIHSKAHAALWRKSLIITGNVCNQIIARNKRAFELVASHMNSAKMTMSPAVPRNQCAAVCWKISKVGPKILLITSRETGRWVLPKGWTMAGRTAAQAAKVEAWEEAGVRGRVEVEPIGTYSYDKVVARNRPEEHLQPCDVAVFALRVRKRKRRFPEAKMRKGRWFRPEVAAGKVHEAGLKDLILRFSPPTMAKKTAP